MEYHERPGVYSNYEMSTVLTSGQGNKTVALAACCPGSGITELTSIHQAQRALEDGTALNLVRLLMMNGAGTVLLCPAADDSAESYDQAIRSLLGEKRAGFMICDCDYQDVQLKMKIAITEAAEAGNECIGVVGMASITTTPLVSRAKSFDCERMMLVAGSAGLSWDAGKSGGIYGAAAMAGLLSGQQDPALPVHGVGLKGLSSLSQKFTESEIDTLVQGGVTQLEAVGGEVSAIRAVTTRTTTAGAADSAWREITTVMIVDDVVPGVRNALRAKFLRKKNNSATRGAIRSQVAVELEKRRQREIIDSYDEITVEQDQEDPTVCLVTFTFAVTHGISRIYLTASITV